MRFHKAHPALAALIALLVIGVTAPLAYAFVRHVMVTVDPDKPTGEIEKDVTDQLHAAGVEANVKATKPDDGTLSIRINSSDQALGSNLAVKVGNETVQAQTGRGITIRCHECDETAQETVAAAMNADAVLDATDDDAAIGPAITKALADKGYTNVSVTLAPEMVTVDVKLR
jgi:preprotein translocase subunit SecF